MKSELFCGYFLLIFVMYLSLRVYDRNTWKYESWSKLKGVCTSAVWSPDNTYFFFSCKGEPLIRAIRFVTRAETSGDGEQLQ